MRTLAAAERGFSFPALPAQVTAPENSSHYCPDMALGEKLTPEAKAELLERLRAKYADDDRDDEVRDRLGFEPPPPPAPPSTDLLLALHRPDFMADALCAEPDYADLAWFPEKGEDTRPAKAVCERCIAVDECKEYALAHGIDHGIWGATSPAERRKLRRAAKAA